MELWKGLAHDVDDLYDKVRERSRKSLFTGYNTAKGEISHRFTQIPLSLNVHDVLSYIET